MKININIVEGACGPCGDKLPPQYTNAHNGEEARMHRTTLAHLVADVKVLLDLVQDEDDLPEWLETKITKAGDYMSSAVRYVAGNKAREMGQLEEQEQMISTQLTPEEVKQQLKDKMAQLEASIDNLSVEDLQKLNQAVASAFVELSEALSYSKGLIYHLENNIPVSENIFRPGSDEYFKLFKEVRELNQKGLYDLIEEEEYFINETSDLGEWGWCEEEGEMVPLDFPLYENASQQLLDEKRKGKKKKKDPPIGKPMKNTGGGKKYKVYVRSKSGRVKKITYGDSKGGLKGNWNNAEARKSFAARHNCADKKDRTQAGYWACRAHKDFGSNVSGRFW